MEKDIEKLIDFMKSILGQDNTGHNHQHSLRVFNNALKIFNGEKQGDKDIISAAAIIHDCVDKKLFNDTNAQIEKVRNALFEVGYAKNQIEEIVYIIQNISWNNGENPPLTNINAMIVRDADRLDAIGVFGIIRTIEYGTSHNRLFYDDENIKLENGKYKFNKSTVSTLSHFYEKLLLLKNLLHTKTALKLAQKRHKFLKKFLDEFYNEL